ncbi:Fc.00g070110.m01.CDS01 [Cosmosporella sp. VM-42]
MSPSTNTSHPRDAMTPDRGILDYSHSRSRFSTPVHDDDITTYDSSVYSQNSDDLSFGVYPQGREPSSSPYDGLPGEMGYHTRVPYTPEASPPTPCPTSEVINTRSGLSIQKRSLLGKSLGVKSGRVQKKSKDPKRRTSTILAKPLSEIAKDMPDIHVADIAAFVARSTDDRLKETSRNKKAGQIKRPMNAFMLYRKAYQDVAKTQCVQNNHQHVSKVCGAGWPMEPEHVHDTFTEWARLERINHQKAHPGYKFTPSKPRKTRRDDGEGEGDSTVYSDADDSDWAGPHGIARGGGQARGVRQMSRLSETPSLAYEQYDSYNGLDGLEPPSMAAYHGIYAYPTPGQQYQVPYSQVDPIPFDLGVHQNPNALGIMQDQYSRTPSPSFEYQQHVDNQAYVDHYYPADGQAFEPAIDPAMLPEAQYSIYDGFSHDMSTDTHAQANWPSHVEGEQDLGPVMGGYDEESAHNAYLRGKQDDWKVEELGEPGHFDDWMVQTDQGLIQ